MEINAIFRFTIFLSSPDTKPKKPA